MEPHHTASIQNLRGAFEKDPTVLALILGGSLAHGFARPDSDIDVSIVIDPAEYARRKRDNKLHYNNRALCTYDQGYIDGKYVDLNFLQLVATRGSDPARYAYHDSRILFSRLAGLDRVLAEIVRFPVEKKKERIDRFAAQLLAWRWYYSEALRQESRYLVILALQKIVLFGGRIVLAENEMLYPYHKWMLRVLHSAKRQPPGLMAAIDELLAEHSWRRVDDYCRGILAFAGLDFGATNAVWPSRFMKDTELKWVEEEPGIDDL